MEQKLWLTRWISLNGLEGIGSSQCTGFTWYLFIRARLTTSLLGYLVAATASTYE